MPSLRDYTKFPFEILIASLTVVPFIALAYFYPALPERVPVLMKLNGDVSVWAGKSFLTVFRVPLIAVVTQSVCLLMKFGTLQSGAGFEQTRYLEVNARLWDWFRWTVAVKLGAASVDTLAISLPQYQFLARPAFVVTMIATGVGVFGAAIYGYRLMVLHKHAKRAGYESQVDSAHVHAGIFYFNSSDPAMFSSKYAFNFANKWVWVFVACVVAYPLLVFLPG